MDATNLVVEPSRGPDNNHIIGDLSRRTFIHVLKGEDLGGSIRKSVPWDKEVSHSSLF